MILGFTFGYHFQTALNFKADWAAVNRFFYQFSWRVPDLEPNTAIYTIEIPIKYSSDNSLIGAFNWIYDAENTSGNFSTAIFYLDLRTGGSLPPMEEHRPIHRMIHFVSFDSSTDDILLIYDAPPRCLRIIHPGYDAGYPALPPLIRNNLRFSNLSLIETENQVNPPGDIFNLEPEHDWCYYFEKADLARQLGDWAGIVELAKEAFQADIEVYYHPSELVPFIQGLAFTGDVKNATTLTLQALKNDPQMKTMLCNIWKDIGKKADIPPQFGDDINKLENRLDCTIQ